MGSIVICSQCGFQTEAEKKFCPNCGAPFGSLEPAVIPASSTKEVAASSLFSALQAKKETGPSAKNQTRAAPTRSTPQSKPVVAVSTSKERPKQFKTKPLGVAKPTTAKPQALEASLTSEIREQLIEFLRGLNKLDRSLEASAVVKRDGTLLASAHSSRAKPEMMATISSTLYGIAKDSIRAISGGKIRLVTITAEQCVLMLTRVDSETILLLVTSPKSNIGLIAMYSEMVGQNIAKFLAKLAS